MNFSQVQPDTSIVYKNVPVITGIDTPTKNMTKLHFGRELGVAVLLLQNYKWVLYGTSNASFNSCITQHNLPFDVYAVLDEKVEGRALAQSYIKTSNIFAKNKELITFLKLQKQTKIQGYFINSPIIAESPRQRLFLREQLVIIFHLKGRNKLLIVAAIIPTSYDTQVTKQFTDKLENVR